MIIDIENDKNCMRLLKEFLRVEKKIFVGKSLKTFLIFI